MRSKRRYSISACAIYWNYTEFAAQSAENLGVASNEDPVLQVLCTILQKKLNEHELYEILPPLPETTFSRRQNSMEISF